jgi:hypothetical protein
MKLIVNAIKYTYDGTLKPMESAFSRFIKLDEDGIRKFKGTQDEHAILTAFQSLKSQGYHFADSKDREDFQALIGMLKHCQEEQRESLQSPRTNPRNRKVRVHHGPGRPLPPQA